MSLVNLLPKLSHAFPKVTTLFLHFGLTAVSYYHLVSDSVFFNTEFASARGIENIANHLLSPVHYLCGAKRVSVDEKTGRYQLKLRFHYETGKSLYTPLALYFFGPGATLGTLCKGLALLSPQVWEKHARLKAQLQETAAISNHAAYQEVGLEITDFLMADSLVALKDERRPEALFHLHAEKEALRAIAEALHTQNIPFWVDGGTLLGTYRYQGVIPWDYDIDIGVIADDFANVMRALNVLDPCKYLAQDWSSRGEPSSYIRVYVKATHTHIDIFHYRLDPKKKTLTFILSYDKSDFMAEAWKTRERTHVNAIPVAVVFPLKKGLFDGIDVPVPQDTKRYLQFRYGQHLEPVRVYNPQTGCYEKNHAHPYWKIPLVK